ncbi:hypothetical protein H6F93_22670 [Leptolyngbya sp. FACHB-671]|uniref:hypothetical protein n=1 Tax=Leptolyngbya sp. FACHB-671 TaxID=2692812 RepID=UPI0016834EF6|nr:hypothetical protein [Leptolyngbya sp. FACHB-671]MBD2070280.1 hypothetical protein [Leptolyngbya sp. FACHB-671]
MLLSKIQVKSQQAIIALLALSGRYPNLMRGIFDSIETCFEEQRTPENAKKTSQTLHLRSSLRDFFERYRLPEDDRYLQHEFEKLSHDALQTEILPRTLTLEDMTHEIFNLIRSFSFVGEIGKTLRIIASVDWQLATRWQEIKQRMVLEMTSQVMLWQRTNGGLLKTCLSFSREQPSIASATLT